MVLNTFTVSAAIAPTIIKTCTSHYLNRKPRRQRPTAHISYDEGLNLIRSFLHYASFHTVEEIQAFTSQWVPTPRWVKVDEVIIPEQLITAAADALIAQLGHRGVDKVGGKVWWQWRRDGTNLKAEWIEMRGDYQRRKERGDKGKRVMLYVHGGAYFFGSVDEHRYQMQRHARKLKARVFARPYELFIEPAAKLTNHSSLSVGTSISVSDPSTIILAGDSAGAGMIVSLLVILRDQGIPLPAGAVLISPWVDLTHSFPSVAGDNTFDYIPSHGFLQRPSEAWPPPNAEDIEQIAIHAVEMVAEKDLPRKSTHLERKAAAEDAIRGFSVDLKPKNINPEGNPDNPAGTEGAGLRPGNTIPGAGHDLSIMIDGKFIGIKDQIQLYTTNQLISHPLVSPVLQPSLGGLPPLLRGGEVLRDEQIYLAHKATNPSKYPPEEAYLNEYPQARAVIEKWKPTDVQLQVWDDLCHVAPTLSFTRPAKYMYRSVAQFSAWALARAQKTEIDIMDDDDVSVISIESEGTSDASSELRKPRQQFQSMENGTAKGGTVASVQIGKAGDSLPPFCNHMIRQRVDRHGRIYPLDPQSSLPALQMSANEIGVIKPGPVSKWLDAKQVWDKRYANEKRRVQNQRVREMAKGFQDFADDDTPPPSALAGRRGLTMPNEKKRHKSMGMSLWSLWGSKHDEKTITREEKADRNPENAIVTSETNGSNAKPVDKSSKLPTIRSRSRRKTVADQGQTTSGHDEDFTSDPSNGEVLRRQTDENEAFHPPSDSNLLSPRYVPLPRTPADESTTALSGENDGQHDGQVVGMARSASGRIRPTKGGVAFPFSLGTKLDEEGRNASTVTLTGQSGIVASVENEDWEGDGDKINGPRSAEGAAAGVDKRPEVKRFETAKEF
ncbi:hypothetical protein MMC11_006445 [Xylographa trunciseda]|nr:hypothetical protein [Xylographa trunciseda]